MFGPVLNYWCMRYEGKHQIFKRHASVVNKFKNIPKTMARVHQDAHCTVWGCAQELAMNEIQCKNGYSINVDEAILIDHVVLQ